jgi:hypothetical protein
MSLPRARRSLLLAIGTTAVFAAMPSANHSWSTYHWARQSNPFTLKVGDNLSNEWDPYLTGAIDDWSLSSVLDLTRVSGGTKPRTCKPTNGQIEACNARYGNTGWLGIAQIWITGGDHITQGITKLNDTYFDTATYDTPEWRRLVTCQEIAHDFGLDHQDENFNNPNLGSCMDYTSDPDGPLDNEHPNQHDYDQLEAIYAHADSTTTISAALPGDAPPAMHQIDFDTPGQWGRLVRSTANRRAQTFELDFGGGNKVITHVFWADPENDSKKGR